MRLRRVRGPLCVQARPRWPATRARTALSFGGLQHVRIRGAWSTGTRSRNAGTVPATARISRLTDKSLTVRRLRRYRKFKCRELDSAATYRVSLQWIDVWFRCKAVIG